MHGLAPFFGVVLVVVVEFQEKIQVCKAFEA
jgi:hypothetical protein